MSLGKQAGFSMIEMIWVIVLMGLLSILGIPRIRNALQKQNVRSARVAGSTLFVKARTAAIQRGCVANVELPGDGRVWVTVCRTAGPGLDTLGGIDNLQDRFGVVMASGRAQWRFDPRGVTAGNQSAWVFFRNTQAADSFWVNPMGKVVR